MGFPIVGGVGLHRETGVAPKLYQVRSIKSIGLEPKSMISRKPVSFSKHSHTISKDLPLYAFCGGLGEP